MRRTTADHDRPAPIRPRRWTAALGLACALAIALPAMTTLAAWPERQECVIRKSNDWCGTTAVGEISEAVRLGTQCKECSLPPGWHEGVRRNQSAGLVLGRFR